jgi:hypothetical protein
LPQAPPVGQKHLLLQGLALLPQLAARAQPVSLLLAVLPRALGLQTPGVVSEPALWAPRRAVASLLAAARAEQQALPARSLREERAHTSRKSGCPRDFHARRICTELSRDQVP